MTTIPSAVRAVREVTQWLAAELPSLTSEEWQLPNACGVWSVADVAGHLLWVADLYGDAVRRALVGDVGPPSAETAPANRVAPDAPRAWQSIWSGWPASRPSIPATYRQDLGDRLPEACASWGLANAALFEHLAPADWDRPAFLPSLPRSVRQLLPLYTFEVGVHGWDILNRVGRAASMPEVSHATLVEALPTEAQASFVPRERLAEPVRYLFVLGPTVPGNSLLTVYGDAFAFEAVPDEAEADTVLSVDPQTYVLLFMRRIGWQQALDSGGVTIVKGQDVAATLPGWFGLT
jgi:hypothetical protein